MHYPENWTKDPNNIQEIEEPDGTKKQVAMPVEGLVLVPQTSPEYWDVHDELTKAPNPAWSNGQAGVNNGQPSDLRGMHDGWITRLERIQNTDL